MLFYFRPLSNVPEVQLLIFVAFLLLYLLSLCGNASVMLVVHLDRSLHTPMYFFLANLAAMEFCYSCAIAPLTLASVLSGIKVTISLADCGTQMFLFIFLSSADCLLLAVMAYDRYVAICHPLRYTLIMSWPISVSFVSGSLVLGFLCALQIAILTFRMPFCGTGEINHFFCDIPTVLQLACSDAHVQQAVLFTVSVAELTIPFLLICISYTFIVVAILRINCSSGRHRAFSTCSSHLMVVFLQYGCGGFIYLRPSFHHKPTYSQAVSVVYTFVTPVLNPLIYSMRNKELKDALSRLPRGKMLTQKN
ncbi:olfactory receptor 10V1 [Alligator mississippiensis]|uniref:Olfactory receptor n=1 Tax=Alligator mississippiensis TaxID=8496 RepID=A0A151MU54_ALLMI|nr:olfactory receptor 10V1 [Alligator mississippiensis]KYO28070.1 olfactory receptor 10V1 [Alligator mississippiensis]